MIIQVPDILSDTKETTSVIYEKIFNFKCLYVDYYVLFLYLHKDNMLLKWDCQRIKRVLKNKKYNIYLLVTYCCVINCLKTQWLKTTIHTYYFKVSCHCCCCSVTKSCLTLCNPMDCDTPGSSVLHYLLEFAQIHFH